MLIKPKDIVRSHLCSLGFHKTSDLPKQYTIICVTGESEPELCKCFNKQVNFCGVTKVSIVRCIYMLIPKPLLSLFKTKILESKHRFLKTARLKNISISFIAAVLAYSNVCYRVVVIEYQLLYTEFIDHQYKNTLGICTEVFQTLISLYLIMSLLINNISIVTINNVTSLPRSW